MLKTEAIVDIYFDGITELNQYAFFSLAVRPNSPRPVPALAPIKPVLEGISSGGRAFPDIPMNSAYNSPDGWITQSFRPWVSKYNTLTGYWRQVLRLRICNDAIYCTWRSEKSFTFE